MRKAGAKDCKSYSKKILKICEHKPISLEVFADDQAMIDQGIKINSWGKNICKSSYYKFKKSIHR